MAVEEERTYFQRSFILNPEDEYPIFKLPEDLDLPDHLGSSLFSPDEIKELSKRDHDEHWTVQSWG